MWAKKANKKQHRTDPKTQDVAFACSERCHLTTAAAGVSSSSLHRDAAAASPNNTLINERLSETITQLSVVTVATYVRHCSIAKRRANAHCRPADHTFSMYRCSIVLNFTRQCVQIIHSNKSSKMYINFRSTMFSYDTLQYNNFKYNLSTKVSFVN